MDFSIVPSTIVIAISGISGSGKTTVSEFLAYKTGQTVIHWDAYDDISTSPPDYVKWYDAGSPKGYDAWDYPKLAYDLSKLKTGETIISSATGEKLIATPIIFFDAPMGKDHSQTKPYIDYWIHLDTPLDISLSQRILRDYNENSTSKEILDAIKYYREKSRPMFLNWPIERPDKTVDGSLPFDILIQEILDDLRSKFKDRL